MCLGSSGSHDTYRRGRLEGEPLNIYLGSNEHSAWSSILPWLQGLIGAVIGAAASFWAQRSLQTGQRLGSARTHAFDALSQAIIGAREKARKTKSFGENAGFQAAMAWDSKRTPPILGGSLMQYVE